MMSRIHRHRRHFSEMPDTKMELKIKYLKIRMNMTFLEIPDTSNSARGAKIRPDAAAEVKFSWRLEKNYFTTYYLHGFYFPSVK